VLSFFIDFMPAIRSKHHQSNETEMDMAIEQGDSATGRLYRDEGRSGAINGTNGYANGANGYTNGTNGYTIGSNGYSNNITSGHLHTHPNERGINADTNYPDGHVPKPLEPVVPSRNF
jgi:hypothetical protein